VDLSTRPIYDRLIRDISKTAPLSLLIGGMTMFPYVSAVPTTCHHHTNQTEDEEGSI